MPVRQLPPNPNLDHLKYQAKDLLKDHAARSQATAQRLREFHPRFRRSSDVEIFNAPPSSPMPSSPLRASRDFRVGRA